MLATLTDRRDFGGDWLLERKFDGERCVARKRDGDVRLESRTGKDLTATYPEIREALLIQRAREFLLDGEVVAYEGEQTSFSRLQQRLGVTAPSPQQMAAYPVVYCIFDVLEINGETLSHRPLDERRARLTRSIRPGPVCSSPKPGATTLSGASPTRAGLAGRDLIAKRVDAPYVPGRSKDWLKLKCVWEQEFVIGGYTDPTGSRTDFGALLVGYHEDGRLRYAGKVGTGYSAARLRDLGARLRSLETSAPPFIDAETDSARHSLDPARPGRADRLRRVDERWAPAATALSRATRRQATGRGDSGAAAMRPPERRPEVRRSEARPSLGSAWPVTPPPR